MVKIDLNTLQLFARVAEAGSFSEGARRLGMPVSTVSRRIADLEHQLGVRLLERSTRSIRLTEIGAEILEHAQRSVTISDAVAEIVSTQLPEVVGTLRISTPPSISDSLVVPLVDAFLVLHPAVDVRILATDRAVDHIAEGIDLTFRVGTLQDSSLVARKLLTYRHQLVASPAYLERHPPPKRPQDILGHRIFGFSRLSKDIQWQFAHKDGRQREVVTFVPRIGINDYAGVAAALQDGLGIGDLPPIVQPGLLRDGRLVEIMTDWRFPTVGLYMVHLGNRHDTRLVRAFKEIAARMVPTLFPNLPD